MMGKKRILRLFSLLLTAVFVFSFAACEAGGGPGILPPDGTETSTPPTGTVISDENNVVQTTPDTADHGFELIAEKDGSYTYQCDHCEEQAIVTISCISGTKDAFTVENNRITFCGIEEESVYSVSGTFYGNLIIDVGEEYPFELELDGFTLSSSSDCPIAIVSEADVTLSAKKGTENYVYDLRGAVDSTEEDVPSSGLYALCDLDIQGKGSLLVYSANNNGIHTKKDLKIKNLTLQVECCDNALKGNDSVTIESGSITLIARSGDGIKTTNSDISSKGKQRGSVVITGGNLLLYTARDGIDAAYDVTIDESSAAVNLQIFTDSYSKFTDRTAAAGYTVQQSAFAPGWPGGGPGGGGFDHGGPGGGGGMNSGNPDKGSESTKGIKADNAVMISAGTITIQAYDDAIHANQGSVLENGAAPQGSVTISGGVLTLQSDDDGIHADGNLTVSGGTVTVIDSYEGLEGNVVTITDGIISVTASDDGINGTATSGTTISISGGTLYVLAGGDGLDSNSTTAYAGILFAGGRSVILSTGRSDSSIDTERGYQYTGGYVIAIGQSGGMSGEASNTQTANKTIKTIQLQKDNYLVVSGIAAVRMPVSLSASVIVLGKTGAAVSSAASVTGEPDANGVSWS